VDDRLYQLPAPLRFAPASAVLAHPAISKLARIMREVNGNSRFQAENCAPVSRGSFKIQETATSTRTVRCCCAAGYGRGLLIWINTRSTWLRMQRGGKIDPVSGSRF